MFNSHPNPLFILIGMLFCSAVTLAQPKDNSPFTRYGLGDLLDSSLPSSYSMGGLGSVYHDFFEANLDNPASLGFMQYTSLQVGTYAKRASLKLFDDKATIWSGNLDQISLNIPLINPLNEALERRETDFAWGSGISLRNFSQLGYFNQTNDTTDIILGEVLRTFTGSGGLYKFTWSNGFKFKNLAAGINLAYIYGQQNFDEETIFVGLENAYRDLFKSSIAYKGVQFRLGFIYEHPLDLKTAREKDDDPSRFISVGIFYEGQSMLTTDKDETLLAINSVLNDVDTASFVIDEEGEAILPNSFGFGLMYRHAGDFRIGIDYQTGMWSDYMNTARPDDLSRTDNTFRLGAGLAWIPDASSITSYFKRVEYRLGFTTLTDPRVIEGAQVKSTSFHLGASFPLVLQRNIAWLQAGLELGKRTGGENLSESFIRGKVGFVLNDNSWFVRGKYN